MRGNWLAGVLTLAVAASPAMAGGEIYGTVTTRDGERLHGPIRWDSDEGYWNDRLDARKTGFVDPAKEKDGFRFSLFGWEIINTEESSRVYRQLSVPFGHLREIRPEGTNEALLVLKDGSELRAEASGSDLGRSLEIVVQDLERGAVELPWRRIERVEFADGPGKGMDDERLYGTVTTPAGEFTGFVVWDRDESMLDDVLDGEEQGEDREVVFRSIESIEPQGASQALVTLRSGDRLTLGGTNDVNDDMRGVVVTVPTGTIEIEWDEVRKVVFAPAPASPRYGSFDGGRALSGTARTRDGEVLEGAITWDMDETYTWETLDGEQDRIKYGISFGHIRSIAPAGSEAAEVKLTDGRTFRLTGSNDVNENNKGVMIRTSDGNETILDWSALERVEFD
jgi:hypothetical protein